MAELIIYAEPGDGTIVKKGPNYTIRTTENYVWAGYDTDTDLNLLYHFKAYFAFDTSSIPAGSTINNAVFSVYVDNVTAYPPGGNPAIGLRHSLWTLPLDATDWDDVAPPTGYIDGPIIIIAPSLIGTRQSYTLSNQSVVIPGGTTYFRLEHVGGVPEGSVRSYVRLGSGNNSDNSKKPKLVITYTPPPPPVSQQTALFIIEGRLTATTSGSGAREVQAQLAVEGLLQAFPSTGSGAPNDIIGNAETHIEGSLLIATVRDRDYSNTPIIIEGMLEAVASVTVPPTSVMEDCPFNISGTLQAVTVEMPPTDHLEYASQYIEGSLIATGFDITLDGDIVSAPLSIEGFLNVVVTAPGALPDTVPFTIEGKLLALTIRPEEQTVYLSHTHTITANAQILAYLMLPYVWASPSPLHITFDTAALPFVTYKSLRSRATFTFSVSAAATKRRYRNLAAVVVVSFSVQTSFLGRL